MKLSIITVNLNNAVGLQKTIDSVVTQTWLDFEFIIVDGASIDGSLDVIQQFNSIFLSVSTIQQFLFVSESDTGVYQAMNKGIRMAKGEYLLFLNSGDFLVDQDVLKTIFYNKNYSEDILCGQCNVSDHGKVVWTTNPPDEITFGTLYYNALAHQSTFIKRSLFNKFGFYREDFKYNSDIEFWYKTIISGGCTTITLHRLIADYNLDGISSTQKKSEAFNNEMVEILSTFNKFTPDYEEFRKERLEMAMYYWLKNKTIFNTCLCWVYQIAKFFKR